MTINDTLAVDRKLSPGYINTFDFSLAFESVILTIAPLGVLIAVCPFHIWHHRKGPAVSKIGLHFWLLEVGRPYCAVLWTKQSSLYLFRLRPLFSLA